MNTTDDDRLLINPFDAAYHGGLKHILHTGRPKTDRTGTGTISTFGMQMRFPLQEGTFPLLTTKRVSFLTILRELLWFISGSTNIRPLVLGSCKIWNEWPFVKWLRTTERQKPPQDSDDWKKLMAEFVSNIKDDADFALKHGDLGPVYGHQWVNWQRRTGGSINQLQQAIDTIQNTPDSRRIIVSAWNPEDVPEMALPPCHYCFQFDVTDGELSCILNQRSADMFLGVPFNIASYSLLLLMMAQVTGLKPGTFIWSGGDVHIYDNHREQVDLQLSRNSKPPPRVRLNPNVTDLFAFTEKDIVLEGYNPHPAIRGPVAV